MYNNNIPSNYSNFMSSSVIRSGEVLIANRGLQHLNCILPQQNSKGGLFLGDVVCLLKQQLLEKHQVQSILTCMVEPISRGQQLKIKNHKILPIRDIIDFPIIQYFKQSRQFIQKSRNQGHNILVHCHAGVSRSATIVCAYLMYKNNWSHEQALNYIREKRYRAKPNVSFLQQLEEYYRREIINNSVSNSINNQIGYMNDIKKDKGQETRPMIGVVRSQVKKQEYLTIESHQIQSIQLKENQMLLRDNILKRQVKIKSQYQNKIQNQNKISNNVPKIQEKQTIISKQPKKQTKKQNQTIQIKLQTQTQTYEDENIKKNLKKPIRRKIFQTGKDDLDKDQQIIRLGSLRYNSSKQSLNISQKPSISIQIPKVMSYNDFQNRSTSHYQNYYPQQNKSQVIKNKYSFSPNMMKSAYYQYSPNVKNQLDEYMLRDNSNNNRNNNNNRNTLDIPMSNMVTYSQQQQQQQIQNNSMFYTPYKDKNVGYSNVDRNYLSPLILPKANTVIMLNRSSKNQDLLNLNNNNRNSIYYERRQLKQ